MSKQIEWRPIEEYQPEWGRVLVWLTWPKDFGEYFHSGSFLLAYSVSLTNGSRVWVDAEKCEPLESVGRRITHFAIPKDPTAPAVPLPVQRLTEVLGEAKP